MKASKKPPIASRAAWWMSRLKRGCLDMGLRFLKYFGDRANAGVARRILDGVSDQFVTAIVADRVAKLPERYQIELAMSLQPSMDMDDHLRACENQSIHLNFASTLADRREVLRQENVPIIVGPWLSEIGFELLYWIPLLRRYQARYGISPTRVVAISRGGAASWYAGLAEQYVDVFDLCTREEFLEGVKDREESQFGKKQFHNCTFGDRLVQGAAKKLGLENYACIHPSLMYQFFKLYWQGTASNNRVTAWCDHSNIPHPYERPAGIPFSRYVAVKFYHSDCFPATPENVAFVNRTVSHLANRTNVVLLNTGIELDDHSDASFHQMPNVFNAAPLMVARNNLEVQSAIVAHSSGLYSTYGGFSYLGPLLGVKTLSFYSHSKFVSEHLETAYRALNRNPDAGFSVVSTAATADLVEPAPFFSSTLKAA